MRKKQHQVVKVIVSRRGIRTDYKVRLNGKILRGRVVYTMSKGERVVRTEFGGQSVPYYDPQWLAARNSIRINLAGHPTMQEAEAAQAPAKEAA